MKEKLEALKLKLIEKKDVLIKVGVAVTCAAVGAGVVLLAQHLANAREEIVEFEALPIEEDEEELEDE